jgi:hypothetical protein
MILRVDLPQIFMTSPHRSMVPLGTTTIRPLPASAPSGLRMFGIEEPSVLHRLNGQGPGSIDTGNALREGDRRKNQAAVRTRPDRGAQIGQVFGAFGSGNDPGKIQDFQASGPVPVGGKRVASWAVQTVPRNLGL